MVVTSRLLGDTDKGDVQVASIEVVPTFEAAAATCGRSSVQLLSLGR